MSTHDGYLIRNLVHTYIIVTWELSEALLFEHRSPVNGNGKPPDNINSRTVLAAVSVLVV